ncbi:uncharacterized protein EHS24_004633 [Apiotrichum porosum]|uniref:Uncharacterized protein n=1 Tax=Apiotrichum porosum TaxID=105984 RepID=A0A427Y5L5_9TREE|nr:uncharacterized protein EHS24_004633 [Apiotrichum porosum]RSH86383.1 hypothetical protein EHS24_004633 [Apiotrichum porosum]
MALSPLTFGAEAVSVSPISTYMSHDSPRSPYSPPVAVAARQPRRAQTLPLEPLTFTKVAVSPAPSVGIPSRSGSTSGVTDSEGGLLSDERDVYSPVSPLSRSPSLLTSLIQAQGRLTKSKTHSPCTTTPPARPMPCSSQFASLPRPPRAQPILRRCSTSGAERLSGLSGASGPSGDEGVKHTETVTSLASVSIRHRRSCLKFAVTPRPLQLAAGSSQQQQQQQLSTATACRPHLSVATPQTPGAGPSTRPRINRVPSYRRSPPPAQSTGTSYDEETYAVAEEEEGDEEVDEEVTTPGFGSDADSAGYEEDSEDGFTSDDEDTVLSLAGRWHHRPAFAPSFATPTPILAPAARRAALPDCPATTTDDGAAIEIRRPPRIRIAAAGQEKYACPRHRSPPPTSVLEAHGPRPAPPAARSPSAAELCRRRTGIARPPPPPSFRPGTVCRGWKSDDGRGHHRNAAPVAKPPPRGLRFQHRRDSAPAAPAVDEVHVLAAAVRAACHRDPRGGLKRVLRACDATATATATATVTGARERL